VLNIDFVYNTKSANLLHSGRGALVVSNGIELGFVGELNPIVQDKIGIPYRIAVCELSVANILKCVTEKSEYTPLSHFPSVERDIAFVVDKKIQHKDILKMINNFHELIESCELFDIYQSDKIGEDKKSMAYHIVYRSSSKTLEAKVVDDIHTKVLDSLKNNFSADIRE